MKNKGTIVTFLLLSCAVIISLLNGTKVSADTKTFNGFDYTVKDNQVIITNYVGLDTNLEIPSHIDNLPVVSIGKEAFAFNERLKTVTIPNTVTTIEDYAFMQCSNLEIINISENVSSIGQIAFLGKSIKVINVHNDNAHFKSVDGVLYSKDSKILIKYPSAKLGSTYTVPATVVKISSNAFNQSNNLVSIQIGNQVEIIEDAAFSDCVNLLTLFLPSSVNTLGRHLLNRCTSLKSVDVDPSNTFFASANGVLYDRDKRILLHYPNGKTNINFTVPSSVTTIGLSAFENNKNIEAVKLPNGILEIRDYAFSGCTSLRNINFPNGLLNIGVGAFIQTDLTEVVLPRTIENIGPRIFYRCLELKTVEIIGSIKTIPEEAFLNCFNLSTVKLPTSINRIEKEAFYVCQNLESIGVLNKVTTIGKDAFKECTKLQLICYKGSLAQEYAIKNKISVATVNPIATPTTSSILLDGTSVKLECYTIDGFNYFKLRDIAMILRDKPSKFEVTWNSKNKAIQLMRGNSYTATGEEMKFSDYTGTINATVTASNLFIDGEEADFSAFTINGYNYFKLRDLAEALHFTVAYDTTNKTIVMETFWGPTQNSLYKTYQYGNSELNVEIRYESRMPFPGNLYVSIDGGKWNPIGDKDYLYGYTGTIAGMEQSLTSNSYIDYKDGWIYVQAINYIDGGDSGIYKVNVETGETLWESQ